MAEVNVTDPPTPRSILPDSLPDGFLDQNVFVQSIIGYLVFFPGFAVLLILWWAVYPLPPDERVSLKTLIAAIWSTFILVGDYLSDVLVTLCLLLGEITVDNDEFEVEAFTESMFIVSTVFLVLAIIGQAFLGKRQSQGEYMFIPSRMVFVALGLYPLYLLMEVVTASYYGSVRAKLGDIVRLKYVQGTVEGIPQIGLLLYLNLLGLEGLQEIVAVSLFFSIASLISGVVMWDFVREVHERDDYDIQPNDINYLLYDEKLTNQNNRSAIRRWLTLSVITRFLECFARLGLYASFALTTKGFGLMALVGADVILLLCYHRYTFLPNVWLELIFNVRDEGNVHVAYGEWKGKFLTSIIAYIVVFARLFTDRNTRILDFDIKANSGTLYGGLAANLALYPWIAFLFWRQRKNNEEIENNEFTTEVVGLEGIRTFDEEGEMAKKERSLRSMITGMFWQN